MAIHLGPNNRQEARIGSRPNFAPSAPPPKGWQSVLSDLEAHRGIASK